MSVPLLSVEGLSLEFATRSGRVHALEDVSFAVGKGEIVGIVGESGSGKSALSFAIMGILDDAAEIRAGSIRFEGVDLLAAKDAFAQVRGREMSMIFQSPRTALNPIRRVGRQIEDVLLRHGPVARRDVKREAISALARVRIPDPEQRYEAYPFELSGGMCQRVMIAMALACSPSMLIADEPTTGLDVTTQAVVMDLIRDIVSDTRMATILITHDLALAGEYCDRILVMHAGHIVESAPAAAFPRRSQAPLHQAPVCRDARRRAVARRSRRHSGSASRLEKRLALLPLPRALRPRDGGMRQRPDPSRRSRAGSPRSLPASSMNAIVEARGLTKLYPMRRGMTRRFLHAVDRVDLAIGERECVGLVGESGCGKSTLARLIARLIEPTAGTLAFDGIEITSASRSARADQRERASVQMVFQDPNESLNPGFTAFEAVANPIRRLVGGLSGNGVAERVARAFDDVGLPRELARRYPHQLSGGQKARVGIARAIAVDPRLIILDEPTSALDASVQSVILKLLGELRAKRNVSYLFVSHDLDVIRLICDRIAVMYLGCIVESGPTDRVLARPAPSLYTRSPRRDSRPGAARQEGGAAGRSCSEPHRSGSTSVPLRRAMSDRGEPVPPHCAATVADRG